MTNNRTGEKAFLHKVAVRKLWFGGSNGSEGEERNPVKEDNNRRTIADPSQVGAARDEKNRNCIHPTAGYGLSCNLTARRLA